MFVRQFYLRQAELCIRLADETRNLPLAERLRAIAADFFDKANRPGEDMSAMPPDIIVDGDKGRG